MKFAVYRSELLSALNRIIKVVPSTKVTPILTYILVEANEGILKLTATDLSNFISVSTKCVSGVDGMALFPAQDISSALRMLNADGVAFAFEHNTLKLRSGKTGWDWKTLSPATFPPIPDWEKSQIFILDKDEFVQSVRRVKPAASVNSFSMNLNQIGMVGGTVQAGDGERFHKVNLSTSDLTVAFPLPFVDDLISILPGLSEDKMEVGVTQDSSAIIVKCDDVLISTKTLAHAFPDLTKNFTIPALTNYSNIKFSKKDLTSSLKRVRLTADKDSRAVKIILSEDSHMRVISQQSSGTKSSDEIVVESVPQNREMVLNIDHLLQALNVFDSDQIEFKLGEDIKNKPSSIYIKDDYGTVVLNQLRSL